MLTYCMYLMKKEFLLFPIVFCCTRHISHSVARLGAVNSLRKGPFFIQLAPEAPSGYFPLKGPVPITAPILTASEAYGTFSNETEDD